MMLSRSLVLRRAFPIASYLLGALLLVACGDGDSNDDVAPLVPKFEVSATDLTFGANGLVACGTTATPGTFIISNTGNADFAWSGELKKGDTSAFSVSPASGTLKGGATVTVTVTPNAVESQAATTPDGLADAFVITTNIADDTPHEVKLHETAQGAILSFGVPAIDFMAVPVTTQGNATFTIANTGNTTATVTPTVGGPDATFFTFEPASAVLEPGVTLGFQAHFKPGTDFTTPRSATLTFAAGDMDTLCAELPKGLALTGIGSNAAIGTSVANLDFNKVPCGSTAVAQTFDITNVGNADAKFTLALGLGAASPYSVTPASGTVPKGDGKTPGKVTVTVTPKGIPAPTKDKPVSTATNAFGDSLTVTTTANGDTPHILQLTETAQGAVLVASAKEIYFGPVAKNTPGTAVYTLTNVGNADATVTITPNNAVFSTITNATVPAGGAADQQPTFTPTDLTQYNATATVTTSNTTLCAVLPSGGSLGYHGHGVNTTPLALSTKSIQLGAVNCGSTAGPQQVTLTNNLNVPLTLSYALANASGYFTVADNCMGTLPAKPGTCIVTVTPVAIPQIASTVAEGFSDTLTIGAKNVGSMIDDTYAVVVHQRAQGAVLFWDNANLTFHGGLTLNASVRNTGNATATLGLTLGGAAAANFGLAMPSITAATSASTTDGVTFTVPASCSGSYAATLSLGLTQGVLCSPLPAPAVLTGYCK